MAQEDIYEQVFALLFDAFLAWAMAQPNWLVLYRWLNLLDAACAPGFEGDRRQVADAAVQLMVVARSHGLVEMAGVFEEMAKEYRSSF